MELRLRMLGHRGDIYELHYARHGEEWLTGTRGTPSHHTMIAPNEGSSSQEYDLHVD